MCRLGSRGSGRAEFTAQRGALDRVEWGTLSGSTFLFEAPVCEWRALHTRPAAGPIGGRRLEHPQPGENFLSFDHLLLISTSPPSSLPRCLCACLPSAFVLKVASLLSACTSCLRLLLP